MTSQQWLLLLKRLPAIVHLELFGTLIFSAAFFMVWPFLTVILNRDYGVSATEIGVYIASSGGISAIAGMYMGYLSDKFGRVPLILIGCVIEGFSFVFIAGANSTAMYAICFIALGFSHALLQTPIKALIGDQIDDQHDRDMTFHLRYFLANVGVAVGPFIGIWFGLSAQQETFYICSLVSFGYATAFFVFTRKTPVTEKQEKTQTNLKEVFAILRADHVFFLFIIANIIVMYVYAYLEGPLLIFLTKSDVASVAQLISVLVTVNACTVITCQFPMLRMMGTWSLTHRIYFGLLLMTCSQICFVSLPLHSWWGWILGVFLMSVAEVILAPTMQLQLDRLAPAHLRGTYYGGASLYGLGFALAPVIGGLFIDTVGGRFLFIFALALCFVVYTLYFKVQRLQAAQNPVPEHV